MARCSKPCTIASAHLSSQRRNQPYSSRCCVAQRKAHRRFGVLIANSEGDVNIGGVASDGAVDVADRQLILVRHAWRLHVTENFRKSAVGAGKVTMSRCHESSRWAQLF